MSPESIHPSSPERLLLSNLYVRDTSTAHSLITATVITGDASSHPSTDLTTFPQRVVYGQIVSQHAHDFPERPVDDLLYINSNAPFSALVCGVQGSGKSHSTSVILESCLIKDPRLGTLPAALSGLVFHLDSAAGGGAVQPCEAAYIGLLHKTHGGSANAPRVTVLVLPTSLTSMRRVYAALPSVRVEPLHFADEDISSSRLLAIMKLAVDEGGKMPLYMEAVMNLLRSMDSEDKFCYQTFKEELKAQKFDRTQMTMLNIRLALLDSCLKGGNAFNRVSNYFKEGQLTIVDLSSPFMDPSSACGFFDIVLGLFVECRTVQTGKIVVLDEAHKYLTENASSSRLTDSLLGIVRQQRHLNMRVLISTQEPTVVPERFLDLCSMVIAHRFSSPSWMEHLSKHISTPDESTSELFTKIVGLPTGQALIFAPTGVGLNRGDEVTGIGSGYLKVQSRLRITLDGGHSILAVANAEFSSRVQQTTRSTPPTPESLPSSSSSSPPFIARPSTAFKVDPSPTSSVSSAVPLSRESSPGVPKTCPPAPVFTASSFEPLVETLTRLHNEGRETVSFSFVGEALKKHSTPPAYGKLGAYLKAAEEKELISIQPDPASKDGQSCVTLVDYYQASPSDASARESGLAVESAPSYTPAVDIGLKAPAISAARFRPLIDVLTRLHGERTDPTITFSEIGAALKSHPKPPSYTKLKLYLEEAESVFILLFYHIRFTVAVGHQPQQQPLVRFIEPRFRALVHVLSQYGTGQRVSRQVMGVHLRKYEPVLEYKKLTKYLAEAEAAGIISVEENVHAPDGEPWISLVSEWA